MNSAGNHSRLSLRARGPTGLIGLTALFVLALLEARSAAAASIHADTRSLPCASRDEIARRIEQLLAPESTLQDQALEISLESARPGVLLVRLHRAASRYDRALPFADEDCGDLARTVAEIARGWLNQPWDGGDRATPPPPPNPGAVSSSPTVQVSVAQRVADAAAREDSAHWQLSLLTGGFVAPRAAQAGLSVAAAGEWEPGARFGLAFLTGFDDAVSSRAGPGTLSVSVVQAALLGRYSRSLAGVGFFDVLAGPSLQLLLARSKVGNDGDWSPAADASALVLLRWRLPLSARWALSSALGLSLRTREERFYLRGVSEPLVLPAARAEALVGVAYML